MKLVSEIAVSQGELQKVDLYLLVVHRTLHFIQLMVAKQQLASTTSSKRMTAYDHVKPNVQTGIAPPSKPTTAKQQQMQNQMRVQAPQTPLKLDFILRIHFAVGYNESLRT